MQMYRNRQNIQNRLNQQKRLNQLNNIAGIPTPVQPQIQPLNVVKPVRRPNMLRGNRRRFPFIVMRR